jgi:2-polyprenyl-3-methyl-5-hydroxy-6-metoxy-1,4-benzoquinol methylase
MLEVLRGKVQQQGLTNVSTQLVDFDQGGKVEGRFHLIVSSMTMHHVPDTAAMLRQLFDLLLPGGQLVVADLEKEDGSFHSDPTGVFHFGFTRPQVTALLEQNGFGEIRAVTAASMVKEIDGQGEREFPVFLVIGRR